MKEGLVVTIDVKIESTSEKRRAVAARVASAVAESLLHEDAERWDTACASCASHYVRDTEINDDDPEADRHLMHWCANCGEAR